MQTITNRTPPSRRNKRQVIAYLDPEKVEAVHNIAATEEKTVQEVIAEAINAAMQIHGKGNVLDPEHYRIVRRRKGLSRVRTSEHAPPCRTGRRSVGGWYEKEAVQAVGDLAHELGVPMQAVVEQGVESLIAKRSKRSGKA